MTLNEAVITLLETIESAGANYVLVGAFAAGRWGIPRTTDDADFVVAMPGPDLDAMLRRLPPAFVVEPQARMELFTGTMRWVIDIPNAGFKMEVFLLGNDPHHQVIFERKRREMIPRVNRQAWIPSPEDLIIQKLRWARPKDVDDIQNILGVQRGGLDFAYLEKWCTRHGTEKRLAEIRKVLPIGL